MLDRPQRQPKNVVIVEGRGGPGPVGGCLSVILILALIGASIRFWYVSVPLLVVVIAGLIYQSRRTGVPVGKRIGTAVEAARQRQPRVGAPTIAGNPENVVIVKKQRGCTCCGTGCVLMAVAIPFSLIAVWDIFGVLAAVLLWPAVFVAAHVVRFATGTQKRYQTCRCSAESGPPVGHSCTP